jgi:HrpA-like RNA helicase
VSAWCDVVSSCSALILDEAHIRSSSYSELFQMVRPLAMQKKLKLVVMSATSQPSKLAEFFGVDNCNTITLDGRLYPLYRFEPEKPMAFESDEDVAVALVDLNTSEASTYEGGILTFVRGQSMVERVAAMLTEKVKEMSG